MFRREEKKQLNSLFFQRFTKYMGSHKSIGGGGNKWEAYRTGVKGIHFRMLTIPNVALAIDLQFKDDEIRHLLFDQFEELGTLLAAEPGKHVVAGAGRHVVAAAGKHGVAGPGSSQSVVSK